MITNKYKYNSTIRFFKKPVSCEDKLTTINKESETIINVKLVLENSENV